MKILRIGRDKLPISTIKERNWKKHCGRNDEEIKLCATRNTELDEFHIEETEDALNSVKIREAADYGAVEIRHPLSYLIILSLIHI